MVQNIAVFNKRIRKFSWLRRSNDNIIDANNDRQMSVYNKYSLHTSVNKYCYLIWQFFDNIWTISIMILNILLYHFIVINTSIGRQFMNILSIVLSEDVHNLEYTCNKLSMICRSSVWVIFFNLLHVFYVRNRKRSKTN